MLEENNFNNYFSNLKKMFDNLNYIMNRATTNHNISPYNTRPIRELMNSYTINEAQLNSNTLKKRYKISSNTKEEYEYQYDPLKMKELKDKLIPPVLNIKDTSALRNQSNKEIYSNPSLTILDCQLGFSMLRSKIEKMKKITQKVLNDNFEYRNKDSALYEFRARMNEEKYKLPQIRGRRANLKQTQMNFSILKENKVIDNTYYIRNDNTAQENLNDIAGSIINEEDIDEEIPVRLSNKDVKERESSCFMMHKPSQKLGMDSYDNNTDDKEETDIDIDLVTSRLAEYITTNMNTHDNDEEVKPRSDRRRFTVADKHFSFKNFLTLSEADIEDDERDDIINPLNNDNRIKTKHFKKKSLSSMELRSILKRSIAFDYKITPYEIESTKTSCKNNSVYENYIFTTDMFTDNKENSCEVNISGFDFKEIFDSEEDNENYKQIALQRLNYFLEENEKEEEKTNQDKKSQNDSSYEKNIIKSLLNNSEVKSPSNKLRKNLVHEIKKSHNHHDEVCKKFIKNPYKFYTDNPSEAILKMCNINSDLGNKSCSNINNLCLRSKSQKKSKKVNYENNITPFDELTLSEIKEEKNTYSII